MSAEKKWQDNYKTYVIDLFKQYDTGDLLYHNIRHTEETVEECEKMIEHYNLSQEDRDVLLCAAWFHDAGYFSDYANHEEASIVMLNEFLKEYKVDAKFKERIVRLIKSTKIDIEPQDLLEEILYDADHITIGKKKFFRRAELLRLEWERQLGLVYDEVEWQNKQLEFLNSAKFYTSYCKVNRNKRRAKNLLEQRSTTHKLNTKKNKLGRGIETMYRSVYKNHINLSSMADSKSNIMISINTIILSVIVAGVGSGFSFSGKDFLEHIRFTIPMTLLLLGCMISALFAVLSASPNVTDKKVNLEKVKERKTSSLFFGNYVNMKLKDFVEALAAMRNNDSLTYDNMSVDIYYLGIVLEKKYRLLRISYMTFLVSLCLCVLSFLVILFSSF